MFFFNYLGFLRHLYGLDSVSISLFLCGVMLVEVVHSPCIWVAMRAHTLLMHACVYLLLCNSLRFAAFYRRCAMSRVQRPETIVKAECHPLHNAH